MNHLGRERYKYLIHNHLAYTYAIKVKKPNLVEQSIILRGKYYQDMFYKTLTLILKAAAKTKTHPVLIKTLKWLGEVVDGDIDVIIAANEFNVFVEALSKVGFRVTFETKTKAVCKRLGFCKIEPRVSVDYAGQTLLNFEQADKNTKTIRHNGLKFRTTNPQVDNLMICLNIIYGPRYLRLYDYLQIVKYGIFDSPFIPQTFYDDIRHFPQLFESDHSITQKYPVFIPTTLYVLWWIRKILFLPTLSVWEKIKKLLYLIYLRCVYIITDRLIYEHEW